MNLNRIFNLKGVNFWLLASGIGLNLIAVMLYLTAGYFSLVREQGVSLWIELFLALGAFLAPFLIGLVLALWAGDGRGPTYSVYGSFGGVAPLVVVAVPNGIFGILLLLFWLLGGVNGGMLAEIIRHRGEKPPPRK